MNHKAGILLTALAIGASTIACNNEFQSTEGSDVPTASPVQTHAISILEKENRLIGIDVNEDDRGDFD
ncbi:MAG: hypothetical protein PVG04_10970 [Anaerolineales bacterium]|jgi:hypothetical protein